MIYDVIIGCPSTFEKRKIIEKYDFVISNPENDLSPQQQFDYVDNILLKPENIYLPYKTVVFTNSPFIFNYLGVCIKRDNLQDNINYFQYKDGEIVELSKNTDEDVLNDALCDLNEQFAQLLENKQKYKSFEDIFTLPFIIKDDDLLCDSNDNIMLECYKPEMLSDLLEILNNTKNKQPYENKDILFKLSDFKNEILFAVNVFDDFKLLFEFGAYGYLKNNLKLSEYVIDTIQLSLMKYIYNKLVEHKTYKNE